MAGLFKISDQSATNSRGAYADMLLDYDQTQTTTSDTLVEEAASQIGESEMDVCDEKEASSNINGEYCNRFRIRRNAHAAPLISSGIYDSLCALQRFFSNPVAITAASDTESGSGMEEFKRSTEIITSAFATHAARPTSATSETAEFQNLFVPRYIPSRDAAEFQVGSVAS